LAELSLPSSPILAEAIKQETNEAMNIARRLTSEKPAFARKMADGHNEHLTKARAIYIE
jgi:hypothetical protein